MNTKHDISSSNSKIFLLGLQHVLAMYAGAVIVPLIVGGALKMNPTQIAYLIAADLLTCGIATLLQVWRNEVCGIGLPVVLGCTFTAVAPMISIGLEHGINAIYGSILCAGIFICIFSDFFGKLKKFFPRVVTGSIVTIIGGTLVNVSIENLAGGVGNERFGHLNYLALGVFVLIFILLINRFFTGYIRSISVLLGLIVGTIIASFAGMIDFTPVADASWFNIVVPFYFGMPTFHFSAILTMIIISLVGIVESTGVFLVLGEICNRELSENDLSKGYRAEGLAIAICGILYSFPKTTFSQNIGLIQLSKVKTTNVIAVAGCILIALSLLPKFAALATIIPSPVLGGAMIVMFGMVIVAGIKMLSTEDLNSNSNLLTIACSIAIGLGISTEPDLFVKLPHTIKVVFGNGIVTGAITAILLNLFLHTDNGDMKVIAHNK